MDNFPSITPAEIKRVLWVLSLAIFTSMLGVGNIVPLLPLYAEGMGASGVALGLIFSAFSLTRSFLNPFIGRMSDQWGRKLFLSAGLFLYGVASIGFLMVTTVRGLILVRVLQGASAGFIIPVAFAYVGDIAPEGQEGKIVSTFSTALFAGFGVGPFLGGLIMRFWSITANFYLMIILSLTAFLIVLFLLPELGQHQRKARGALPKFSEILKSANMWALFLFRFAGAMARGVMMTFLPVVAVRYAVMSPDQIGIAISSNTLIMAFLQTPFGRLSDRMDRFKMVIVGSALSGGLMLVFPHVRSFWPILGSCLIMGAAASWAMPAAMALCVAEGRIYGQGSVTGFLTWEWVSVWAWGLFWPEKQLTWWACLMHSILRRWLGCWGRCPSAFWQIEKRPSR